MEELKLGLGILEQMRLQQENSTPIEIKPFTVNMYEEMLEMFKNLPSPAYRPPQMFLVKSYLEALDDIEFVWLLENHDTMGGSEAVTYATERYDKIKKKELVVSKMRRR